MPRKEYNIRGIEAQGWDQVASALEITSGTTELEAADPMAMDSRGIVKP